MTQPTTDPRQLRAYGFFGQASGYGEIARKLMFAVSPYLRPICCARMSKPGEVGIAVEPEMKRFLETSGPQEPHVSMYICNSQLIPRIVRDDEEAKFRVAYTMTEGRGRLSREAQEALSGIDLVIVPGELCKQVFVNSGISEDRIAVVPIGIEASRRPFKPLMKAVGEFIFLTVFDWKWRLRKGFDKVLSAYLQAFDAGDRVLLAVKTNAPEDEFFRILQYAYKLSGKKKGPPILPLLGINESVDMQALYLGSDCFVLPTRADAWALPIMEAMAAGLPVIVTAEGGHREYCTWHNSILVDVEFWEDAPTDDPMFENLQWAEPSEKSLIHQMRWAYEHRGAAFQIGQQGRKTAEKFSWKNSAERLVEVLRRFVPSILN